MRVLPLAWRPLPLCTAAAARQPPAMQPPAMQLAWPQHVRKTLPEWVVEGSVFENRKRECESREVMDTDKVRCGLCRALGADTGGGGMLQKA